MARRGGLTPLLRWCRIGSSSQLLEAILGGRYAAGEKLPTQRALAADLGVTMSSVREALKRLEQMGLVDVRHGSAMRVRDWREHGGLDVLTHLLFRGGALDPGVLAAILEARALMLRELAGLAAERRSARRRLERLHELAARFAAADAPARRGARRLRVLHRGRAGRRQPRLRADPQRDPRALLRAPRRRPGHGAARRAGPDLRADRARDRPARRRTARAPPPSSSPSRQAEQVGG